MRKLLPSTMGQSRGGSNPITSASQPPQRVETYTVNVDGRNFSVAVGPGDGRAGDSTDGGQRNPGNTGSRQRGRD